MNFEVDIRPIKQIQRFYTGQYSEGGITSRCPLGTNLSLAKRAKVKIDTLPEEATVLDLGAGAFYFTRMVDTLYKLENQTFPNKRLISIDLAPVIKAPHLPTHAVQADGAFIPLKDEVIDLAVSNLAMDLMGNEAALELMRVLRPGASALINLMQSIMLPTKLDQIDPSTLTLSQRDTYDSCIYLKENNILHDNPDMLAENYKKLGFQVLSILPGQSTGKDKWWEVELRKPF